MGQNILQNELDPAWKQRVPGGQRPKITNIPWMGATSNIRAMGTKRKGVLPNKLFSNGHALASFSVPMEIPIGDEDDLPIPPRPIKSAQTVKPKPVNTPPPPPPSPLTPGEIPLNVKVREVPKVKTELRLKGNGLLPLVGAVGATGAGLLGLKYYLDKRRRQEESSYAYMGDIAMFTTSRVTGTTIYDYSEEDFKKLKPEEKKYILANSSPDAMPVNPEARRKQAEQRREREQALTSSREGRGWINTTLSATREARAWGNL